MLLNTDNNDIAAFIDALRQSENDMLRDDNGTTVLRIEAVGTFVPPNPTEKETD